MILNFQENYSKAQKELLNKNKEIQKLIKNVNEKQEKISNLNKKLEYQYQLNEKLLEETENINKTKQLIEMKKLYLYDPKQNNKVNLMSQIYDLKNKLSIEKGKNSFLSKNLEKMKYNNVKYGEEDNYKLNSSQKYNKNISKKTIIEEEDEDCDIMSEYSLNEFIYILTKCFEAKHIDITIIESQILNNDTFKLFNPKENYRNFILQIASNLCLILKM